MGDASNVDESESFGLHVAGSGGRRTAVGGSRVSKFDCVTFWVDPCDLWPDD
jgi:hypothetical protein